MAILTFTVISRIASKACFREGVSARTAPSWRGGHIRASVALVCCNDGLLLKKRHFQVLLLKGRAVIGTQCRSMMASANCTRHCHCIWKVDLVGAGGGFPMPGQRLQATQKPPSGHSPGRTDTNLRLGQTLRATLDISAGAFRRGSSKSSANPGIYPPIRGNGENEAERAQRRSFLLFDHHLKRCFKVFPTSFRSFSSFFTGFFGCAG